MNNVFIGGSRKISRLSNEVRRRIDNIVSNDYTVLVGDANGVDKAVQNYLFQIKYGKVIVFCVADNCRNNIGRWSLKSILPVNKTKNFDYYSLKDAEMVKQADYGFMIWDAKSKGTLNNMINLLKDNKAVLLYYSPEKIFYTMTNLPELKIILARCGKNSIEILEKQLNLLKPFNQGASQELINIAEKNTGPYQTTLDILSPKDKIITNQNINFDDSKQI